MQEELGESSGYQINIADCSEHDGPSFNAEKIRNGDFANRAVGVFSRGAFVRQPKGGDNGDRQYSCYKESSVHTAGFISI